MAGTPTPAAGLPPAFTVVRETLRLLPFDVRLSRLGQVMGLPTTDKLFDAMRARRLELGDQDYGKGVAPDNSWSPNRMALWIKLLRPLCQSAAFSAKYPMVKTDASALVAAAYGRPADATDLDSIRAGLAGVPDERKAELSCLGVLTGVEFVAR